MGVKTAKQHFAFIPFYCSDSVWGLKKCQVRKVRSNVCQQLSFGLRFSPSPCNQSVLHMFSPAACTCLFVQMDREVDPNSTLYLDARC